MKNSKENIITVFEIILIICLIVLPNLYYSSISLLFSNLDSENLLFGNMFNRRNLISLNSYIWLIIHSLQVLIPVLFIIYIKNEDFKDYGFIKINIGNIIKGLFHILLIYIIVLIVFAILFGVIITFLFFNNLVGDLNNKIFDNFKNIQKEKINVIIIILFLLPLLLNSITEELVFRSFLFNK